jgi:hypothetical protein
MANLKMAALYSQIFKFTNFQNLIATEYTEVHLAYKTKKAAPESGAA